MIISQLYSQLTQLKNLVETMAAEQYTKQVKHLGNASIGAHTRHIIELLQCAINGYDTGVADYHNRQRNLLLEIDPGVAVAHLSELLKRIDLPDKPMTLVTDENTNGKKEVVVHSSFFREVVYNTEHTIHHLALIKVALIELQLSIPDKNFGMAYSTIKYHASIGNQ